MAAVLPLNTPRIVPRSHSCTRVGAATSAFPLPSSCAKRPGKPGRFPLIHTPTCRFTYAFPLQPYLHTADTRNRPSPQQHAFLPIPPSRPRPSPGPPGHAADYRSKKAAPQTQKKPVLLQATGLVAKYSDITGCNSPARNV